MNQIDAKYMGSLSALEKMRAEDQQGSAVATMYLSYHEGMGPRHLEAQFLHLYSRCQKLLLQSMDEEEAEAYLKPVYAAFQKYRDNTLDRDFVTRGFVLFRSKDGMVVENLLVPPPNLAVVADSFHIKPFLADKMLGQKSYLVEEDGDDVVVSVVTRQGITLLDRFGFPSSDELSTLQAEKITPVLVGINHYRWYKQSQLRRRMAQAMEKMDFRIKGLTLVGSHAWRLRFKAALPSERAFSLLAEFKETRDKGKLHGAILERMSNEATIATKANIRKLVEARDQKYISTCPQDIGKAALDGRISYLYVDPQVQLWGNYDRFFGDFVAHLSQRSDYDDCIVDDILEEALRADANVGFFDSISAKVDFPLVAVYRW